jgi:hypothetical protein
MLSLDQIVKTMQAGMPRNPELQNAGRGGLLAFHEFERNFGDGGTAKLH